MVTVVNKKTHTPTPDDIYCGRGSALGNIYDFRNSTHPQVKHHCKTRGECIVGFEKHLLESIQNGDPQFCDFLNKLIIRKFLGQDSNLVCYCAPEPCHCEVIKTYVEQAKYCLNWFSNMRKMDSPIVHQGIEYWTVENFYQACKIPRSNKELRQVFALKNPYKAKVDIRKETIDPSWTREKALEVMEYAIQRKFAKGTSWREKLDSFKGPIIETNNWRDSWWGVDIFTMEGENHLGKLIEKQRS